ncbi:demethoxyubiquinone hydroxylase family protein [Dongia rigui]|uniref:3-demethoxyubiquinol 3-hydroxylase n=2 Tax=Dongia rigui TaxID=940149 RepID=A0ABU5DX50_9PROT|nr:demethoxyubiquinone hydroxylase family protein [Dongia rigui]MDY0871875.1 demethoxyubiquinone hydroxylase family protein [Dongia rigui]
MTPQTTPPGAATARRLPGDPTPAALLDRVIRVDHAGEYGAKRIYEGQLAILGRKHEGPVIRHMLEQELKHLDAFEKFMVERRARPSVLLPIWHVAGFALGAATALMGPKAAMACTVAVEEVIDEHYREQLGKLGTAEPSLTEKIEVFRAEEVEHRDTGLAHGAEQAPAYPVLSSAIKAGSRLAIWLAERF